jgi:hypothetical protein
MNSSFVQLHNPAYMAELRLTAKYLRDYIGAFANPKDI